METFTMPRVKQWPYRNGWLECWCEDDRYFWQVGVKRRALPYGTEPGSRINAYGDMHGGGYPGPRAWAWVDTATQSLYISNIVRDTCCYVPRAGDRLGDLIWLGSETVLCVEEHADASYSLRVVHRTYGSCRVIRHTERCLGAPFVWNGGMGIVSWNPEDMPWEESRVECAHGGVWERMDLPQAAWSQPKIFQNKLYLIGALEEYRGVYQVAASGLTRVTPAHLEVGALEWLRMRQDYCFWKGHLYYAAQYAGVWSWFKDEDRLPIPYTMHESWWATASGPVVEGSHSLGYGFSRADGVVFGHVAYSCPMALWDQRLDTLPNGHHSQTWFQRASGEVQGSMIYLHGGPADVSGPRNHEPTAQYVLQGWDVYHVNLIGSSGMGRSVREALNGCWGPGDAEDLMYTLQLWAQTSFLRGSRLVGQGKSSSAWTLLYACHKIRFDACIFYYPVLDAHALLEQGEPFERGYARKLLGPHPLPERPKLPLCIFHGASDTVVPAALVRAWWEQHDCAQYGGELVFFSGEGHGFRSASKKEAWRREGAFLKSVMDKKLNYE